MAYGSLFFAGPATGSFAVLLAVGFDLAAAVSAAAAGTASNASTKIVRLNLRMLSPFFLADSFCSLIEMSIPRFTIPASMTGVVFHEPKNQS